MKTEVAECDTEYYFWSSYSTMARPFCNGEGKREASFERIAEQRDSYSLADRMVREGGFEPPRDIETL